MNTKILVIGANGQLGHEFQYLAKDNSWATFSYVDFPEFDLTQKDQMDLFVENMQPDYIINCAAYTAVDLAEEQSELAFSVNAKGVQNLAELCAKYNVRLVHISTDYVFDGTNSSPYQEDEPVKPNSVYGASKEQGEQMILASSCDAIILRTSWLYSIYGNNFMKTMVRLGQDRDQLGVIFDQVGTPTYARHLARAICTIIEKSEKEEAQFTNGVYHFSNEGVCSWYDFTLAIHHLYGEIECKVLPIETKDYPTAAKRPAYSVLNKTKIKKTFDIEIPNWWYGLKECIDNYKVD